MRQRVCADKTVASPDACGYASSGWRMIHFSSACRHPRLVRSEGQSCDDVSSSRSSAVRRPFGQPAVALVHRPLFPGTRPEEKVYQSASRSKDLHRESIWISYCRVSAKGEERHLCEFVAHHRLASPEAGWERLKIAAARRPLYVAMAG